jgi:hypothetical protein
VQAVGTNLPLLQRVLGGRAYQAGEVRTAFVERYKAELMY